MEDLTNIICNDNNGLTVNKDKTKQFNLIESENETLEYLGYEMSFSKGTVKLELTKEKVLKYTSRLSKSFDAYHKTSKFNGQKARKLLVKRIRFLTSNTRLLNNKKNTIVGVYFSNRLLDDLKSFTTIDQHLQDKISEIAHDTLKKRLCNLSFSEGFSQRRYARFTTAELKKITMVWKHAY